MLPSAESLGKMKERGKKKKRDETFRVERDNLEEIKLILEEKSLKKFMFSTFSPPNSSPESPFE
jgi:hypothetical protein